jgi:hypothetical protein
VRWEHIRRTLLTVRGGDGNPANEEKRGGAERGISEAIVRIAPIK